MPYCQFTNDDQMDVVDITIVTLLPTGVEINHSIVVVLVIRAQAYTVAFSQPFNR